MRIKENYFVEIPDDLKVEDIETTVLQIKDLCQSVCVTQDLK